jgi:protein-S-isoprenylcysteine O-methyltransferase Ste14
MKASQNSLYFDIANLAAGVLMAPLWAWFAYRHVTAFLLMNECSYLFLCIAETLGAAFLLIRKTPSSVSVSPFDWVIAIVGTFASFLLVPVDWGLVPQASNIVILGTGLTVLGMISLNRSFALVAAKREIKTSGMYQFVRHPLYASYLLTLTAYVLSNTSWENLIAYLFTMGCMFIRMIREENHLSMDSEYRSYMGQVPYRIIPYVF